jgi:hypothetical protein
MTLDSRLLHFLMCYCSGSTAKGNKDTKGAKERKKDGKGRIYERNHSPLISDRSFSQVLTYY